MILSRPKEDGGTAWVSLPGTEPHCLHSPSGRGLQTAHHHVHNGEHSPQKEVGEPGERTGLGGHNACCGCVRAKVLITRTSVKAGCV